MARQRKDRSSPAIKLAQPDRSGPTEKTLLDLAQERNLFEQAKQREQERAFEKQQQGKKKKSSAQNEESSGDEEDGDDDVPDPAVLSPGAERVLESVLWVSTMAMLHFTLDVLVQSQYGLEIRWDTITKRTFIAWPVFFLLFHPLHPHTASPPLVPALISARYQRPTRQLIFFLMSCLSGCAVIQITNDQGYVAVMKRAPPLACLWVWAVVELDLPWAALSLAIAGGFLWGSGYSII